MQNVQNGSNTIAQAVDLKKASHFFFIIALTYTQSKEVSRRIAQFERQQAVLPCLSLKILCCGEYKNS
jgi:hypothetical protein